MLASPRARRGDDTLPDSIEQVHVAVQLSLVVMGCTTCITTYGAPVRALGGGGGQQRDAPQLSTCLSSQTERARREARTTGVSDEVLYHQV
jgi:hypothetical protein